MNPNTDKNFCLKHTRPTVGGVCPGCEAEAITPEQKQIIEHNQKVKQRLEVCGVPFRFKDKRISNYKSESRESMLAHKTVSKYAQNIQSRIDAGGGLTMFGTCGTGKTHLACGLVTNVIEQGFDAKYTKIFDLIGSIKDSWSNPNLAEHEVIQSFVTPDLLVIDEVGVQYGSEVEQQLLFRVLNARYEQIKPTVIVSNLDRQELSDCIGERTIDRLKEGQGAEIAFTWESHRK